MGSRIVEVVLKALVGGAFVLAFAALAETLSPKRLAGVFSAAPSVALASLIVTAGFTGVGDVLASAHGMWIGAAGFALYCVAAVPLVRRWGAWRGALAALTVWGAVAAAGYGLVPSEAQAHRPGVRTPSGWES
ncbi:hypothetical protein [Microbispora sp. ATCC PTA-5024]|uniref:hypothetical protein n=1 Tax=Microbispora sp. ATCC PTA-5024 TaxID=316330 RepID=UPI0003DCA45A|nr:hypothetical protein [Microbispora sp. ATCC PTA-5024]ETK30610.1 hypothetical protein MPTA5024_39340 [Microbispora sp. ATCC PTA-5024]